MIDSYENYLARVSFAGVPHGIEHSEDLSQATLSTLTPQDVCQLYWTLYALNVSYTYSLNGTQVSRSFSASQSLPPKERIVEPAAFYVSNYDPSTQTSYALNLSFDCVYFNAADHSSIGLKLSVDEMDNSGLFRLGLKQIPNMASVSKKFLFMDKIETAYLNYQPSAVTSATLLNFSITPQFFGQ